ncbi:hypothetical protein CVT24_012282 [Panaeolus cyanescens]|uniref:Uncharacterized protein n=1 Tax=Panaeolus cyanescens TaxID=181874 RepID=A0A409WE73_9AGAR|nr:hypothetical protein CVT24_012282 [Panaeolus cyanescens]
MPVPRTPQRSSNPLPGDSPSNPLVVASSPPVPSPPVPSPSMSPPAFLFAGMVPPAPPPPQDPWTPSQPSASESWPWPSGTARAPSRSPTPPSHPWGQNPNSEWGNWHRRPDHGQVLLDADNITYDPNWRDVVNEGALVNGCDHSSSSDDEYQPSDTEITTVSPRITRAREREHQQQQRGGDIASGSTGSSAVIPGEPAAPPQPPSLASHLPYTTHHRRNLAYVHVPNIIRGPPRPSSHSAASSQPGPSQRCRRRRSHSPESTQPRPNQRQRRSPPTESISEPGPSRRRRRPRGAARLSGVEITEMLRAQIRERREREGEEEEEEERRGEVEEETRQEEEDDDQDDEEDETDRVNRERMDAEARRMEEQNAECFAEMEQEWQEWERRRREEMDVDAVERSDTTQDPVESERREMRERAAAAAQLRLERALAELPQGQ